MENSSKSSIDNTGARHWHTYATRDIARLLNVSVEDVAQCMRVRGQVLEPSIYN